MSVAIRLVVVLLFGIAAVATAYAIGHTETALLTALLYIVAIPLIDEATSQVVDRVRSPTV